MFFEHIILVLSHTFSVYLVVAKYLNWKCIFLRLGHIESKFAITNKNSFLAKFVGICGTHMCLKAH